MAVVADLGQCKLLRSNTNYVRQCLLQNDKCTRNPQRSELLWTDGECVWLSPATFNSNCTDVHVSTETLLVGEFGDFVIGTACSPLAVTKQQDQRELQGNFIVVVLRQKVVVLFRKVGESVVQLVKEYVVECLPQGYAWHPTMPLLSILSRTSAVVLKFSAGFGCDVIPVQTYHRILNASAWSKDGKNLAVAAQENLLIFHCKDPCKLQKFTCVRWSSLEMTSRISCVIPWQSASFIISTDLPLDKLCADKQCDVFEVDNLQHHVTLEDAQNMHAVNGVLNSDTIDITIPSQRADHCNPLLKFKLKNSESQVLSSMAQLIAIRCEEDKPREISRTSIKGLISPDLLLFQPLSGTIVVGSHSCSTLHCYTLLPSHSSDNSELKKVKEIHLDANKKPKGICVIPGHSTSFLALLGKAREAPDVAFPPSALHKQYDMSLECFDTSTDGKDITDNADEKAGNQKSFEPVFKGANLDNRLVLYKTESATSLRLPDGSLFQDSEERNSEKKCLISEVESTEESMLGECCREIIDNKKVDDKGTTILEHIQELQATVRELDSCINKRLSLLDSRINEICSKQDMGDNHCSYPLVHNAEFVCVVWTDELTGAVEQENFLLDKGRLSLKTIQHAFNASLVRICIGEVPCIVSAGEDGLIPVKFLSGSTVHLSGHSLP